MFIYSDEKQPFTGSPAKVWEMDATKMYLGHYANQLYLDFIVANPRATFAEKSQAEKELKICRRKMAFWQKHPNFDVKRATEGCIAEKKKWG